MTPLASSPRLGDAYPSRRPRAIGVIMLATDLGPASSTATDRAIEIATRLGARLLVTSVVGPGRGDGVGSGRRIDQLRAELESGVQAVVEEARANGANATFLVWEGDPGEAIVSAAEAEGADLIVVGSHGRGPVGRFLVGSVSDFIVRHASCPVLVVRSEPVPRRVS
jgi:nucleotide-binding universal stress UspA family protein